MTSVSAASKLPTVPLRARVAIVEHEDQPVARNDDLWFLEQDALLAGRVGRHPLDEDIIVERDLVGGERLCRCEGGDQKEKSLAHANLHQSILVLKVTVWVWPPATVPSCTRIRVPL